MARIVTLPLENDITDGPCAVLVDGVFDDNFRLLRQGFVVCDDTMMTQGVVGR